MTDKPTKAAHTSGPCRVAGDSGAGGINIRKGNGEDGLGIIIARASGRMADPESLANAELIAEAFNVATETGMTPRQLADAIENGKARNGFERDEFKATLKRMESERAELLEALRPFADALVSDRGEIIGLLREDINRARAAIAKAGAA